MEIAPRLIYKGLIYHTVAIFILVVAALCVTLNLFSITKESLWILRITVHHSSASTDPLSTLTAAPELRPLLIALSIAVIV